MYIYSFMVRGKAKRLNIRLMQSEVFADENRIIVLILQV